MYNQNYDGNNGRNGNSMWPFIAGIAVGVASTIFYSAARNGRFGETVSERIHGFEDRVGNVKNTVVEKAGTIKNAVANRFNRNDAEEGESNWESQQGQEANEMSGSTGGRRSRRNEGEAQAS